MLRDEGRCSADAFLAQARDLGTRSTLDLDAMLDRADGGRMGLAGVLVALVRRCGCPIAAGASCCSHRRPPSSPRRVGRAAPATRRRPMGGAAEFLARFFPLFLLGALFGKLMDDSGSVEIIARSAPRRSGPHVPPARWRSPAPSSPMAASACSSPSWSIVPMAESLFKTADIPHRRVPATIALGTMTFTMSALPGTPALQNAIPMPFFGTTPFAAPGLGIIAAAIMLGFGLWWLNRAEGAARRAGGKLRQARACRRGDAGAVGTRACHHRERIRSRRDRAWPPHRKRAKRAGGRPAADRRHFCQSHHEPLGAAASRHGLSRRSALGRNIPRRGRWCVVRGGGAVCGDPGVDRAQLPAPVRLCAKVWTLAPTPRCSPPSAWRVSSASGR